MAKQSQDSWVYFGILIPLALSAMVMFSATGASATDRALPDAIVNPPAQTSPNLNVEIPTLQDDMLADEADPQDSDKSLVRPIIYRGLDHLPLAVRTKWRRLHNATQRGNISLFSDIISENGAAPSFTFDDHEGTVDVLRELSGDEEGHEILAIMQEILEAGYVHLNPGTETEMYIWPYFTAYPLDELSNEQRVELFRIITAGDFEEMQLYGSYIFFRLGISPDGTWHYFLAGD